MNLCTGGALTRLSFVQGSGSVVMEFRSIDSLIIDTLITQLSDDGRRPQTKGFSGAPMSNQFFIFFILFRNLSTARYRTLFLMRNLKAFGKKNNF